MGLGLSCNRGNCTCIWVAKWTGLESEAICSPTKKISLGWNIFADSRHPRPVGYTSASPKVSKHGL